MITYNGLYLLFFEFEQSSATGSHTYNLEWLNEKCNIPFQFNNYVYRCDTGPEISSLFHSLRKQIFDLINMQM